MFQVTIKIMKLTYLHLSLFNLKQVVLKQASVFPLSNMIIEIRIFKLPCKTKFSVYGEVRHGAINHMIVISATGNDNGSSKRF